MNQTEQRFLLRWHRHASTVSEQLPLMLDNELFVDVTLSVEGQLFKAHRLILASCSSYFLHIFQEADKTLVDHPFIILSNVNVDDIKAILSFMYKGECCVSKDRVSDLLATARNLKVYGLSEIRLDENFQPNSEDIVKCIKDNGSSSKVISCFKPSTNDVKQSYDIPETCKCFICGKYLSNQYNLRVHMETHEETYHACNACPHISRSRDALRKHMSYRHPDKCQFRRQRKK